MLRLLMVAGVAALASVGYLWWVLLSPFSYQFPEEMAPDPAASHQVFVYGTLTRRPVRWLVMGRAGETRPYTLQDYRKTGLDIRPAPGAQVEGQVLRVSAAELRRLDRYERLGIRYLRDQITLSDGSPAWVYVRLSDDD